MLGVQSNECHKGFNPAVREMPGKQRKGSNGGWFPMASSDWVRGVEVLDTIRE